MDIYLIGAIIGGSFMLIAFFLQNFHELDKKTLIDEWLNLIGAILLVLYAYQQQAWPFIATNGLWGGWSFYLLISQLKNKKL